MLDTIEKYDIIEEAYHDNHLNIIFDMIFLNKTPTAAQK
jgi:hypothetical protein